MVTEEILEREGRLDILVNNAGIGNAPHPSTPDVGLLDDWRQMLRVNGEGTFLGCKYGIAAMLSSGGGSDRKSTRLNSSHSCESRMPSSACKKKNQQTHI